MPHFFRILKAKAARAGVALSVLVGSAVGGEGREIRSSKVVKVSLVRRSGLSLEIRTAVLLAYEQLEKLLYSLGLEENPPSSEEITRRVADRCE